jgi:hypothetical protein
MASADLDFLRIEVAENPSSLMEADQGESIIRLRFFFVLGPLRAYRLSFNFRSIWSAIKERVASGSVVSGGIKIRGWNE